MENEGREKSGQKGGAKSVRILGIFSHLLWVEHHICELQKLQETPPPKDTRFLNFFRTRAGVSMRPEEKLWYKKIQEKWTV